LTDDPLDLPRPVPPDCPWSIGRFREAGGDETPRFEADLLRDGVRVAVVSNGGTGGCHRYVPAVEGGWRAVREFEAYGESWGAALGIPWEPHDLLIYELIDAWFDRQQRR